MSMEQVQEFLSTPQIADIISYALILIALIGQIFIKKFVKKDNMQTLFKIDTKADNLEKLRLELSERDKEVKAEGERLMQERESMQKRFDELEGEIASLKQIVKAGFGNIGGLVKNGVANKIAKALTESCEIDEIKNINEESI